MNIPEKYQYLTKLEGPRVIIEGLKLVGTKEIAGAKHNPIILGWAKTLGIANIVKDDEQAWCGLAEAIVDINAGKEVPLQGWDILRALKYKEFGVPVAIEDAMLGDTLIFQREGGGHVGKYVAESKTTFHVMGGNQSNQYGFTEINKDRCVAVRRPHYNNQPVQVKKYFINSSGKVSTNEQ